MPTRRKTEQQRAKPESRAVPIEWASDSQLRTVYANQLLVTHVGREFYLTFGELAPPLITSDEDLPDKLEVTPVVRIAIAPDAMVLIARAIQNNVERYQSIVQAVKPESEGIK